MKPPCPRASVDAHFAGRLSPEGERSLRGHLPECAVCRAYYERHLLLAQLDPSAMSAPSRLAAGLGLESSWRAPRLPLVAWATCAAVLALFVALPLRRPAAGDFTARGVSAAPDSSPPSAPPARLMVYRMRPLEGLTPSVSTLRTTDDLAFAYANPARFRHLLVFGVDEHSHVYWYYPAWTDEKEDPQAIDVESGADVHELPEAISHALDGQELTVFAVFLDDPLSVREVESLVAHRVGSAVDEPLPLPAAYQQRLHFAVQH